VEDRISRGHPTARLASPWDRAVLLSPFLASTGPEAHRTRRNFEISRIAGKDNQEALGQVSDARFETARIWRRSSLIWAAAMVAIFRLLVREVSDVTIILLLQYGTIRDAKRARAGGRWR
jgi:hypothetical protein